MYSYDWDEKTGGFLLNSSILEFSKEPRPVYYKELDLLGLNRYWNYAKDDTYPYMWAESNNYFYRGRKVAMVKGGACYVAPEIRILEEAEPNGKELRPIDIPLMVEKNKGPLEGLVQETIKKVYNTYVEYQNSVDLFYVAFSGGKDSVVTLDVVQRALPHNAFWVVFGDTKMEFPDTYDVIEKIEAKCKEQGIRFLKAASELEPEYTWRKFGPPAQIMRWCCGVHKTVPQILLLRKEMKNSHFRGMAFTGIRGDESVSRSGYGDISLGEKVKGQYSCHPIIRWNSAELFLYIYQNNLCINAAYKKGNSRVGCLVCPMATSKNMFFKEQSYSKSKSGARSTTDFNNIILETTAKELSSKAAVKEFMNIGGWKARRSGRELSFAKNICEETFENGVFKVKLIEQTTDWKEWIKTVGDVTYLSNGDVEVAYKDKMYRIVNSIEGGVDTFTVNIETNTRTDIYFVSALRHVFRKAAYCIQCRVCEANCPNGFINMDDGRVKIDNKCIKCQKCHDVFYGCLLANSLRLPKGEKKMGSIDRYGNMGIEYTWVKKYFAKKDDFWKSAHGLGTNMIKYLKSFLSDSEVIYKGLITPFGKTIDKIGIENITAWGLMLCNLVYTSQFNWWVKNAKLGLIYTPDAIISMLPEEMSNNSKSHIVSAYKNIFISNSYLSNDIRLGVCDYELKNGKRFLKNIRRESWQNPDPLVILYSLYKFAEACGGYYQFTLSRLLNNDIDSTGISPTEIFGINREKMVKILNGLSVNYPDLISVSFTLDLDNINLKNDKTAADVLCLF